MRNENPEEYTKNTYCRNKYYFKVTSRIIHVHTFVSVCIECPVAEFMIQPLWHGMVCGVVWCGVVWCGVVWCGVVILFDILYR